MANSKALDNEAHSLKLKEHVKIATDTYGRGDRIRTRGIKNKKLRGNLKTLEDKYKQAAIRAKDAEVLLEHEGGLLEPEGPLERTYKVRQDEIVSQVSIEAAKKKFELKLTELGPYMASYSRNGRDLLLAGKKGHIATMDWRDGKLGCEIQLMETVRDATWLHNNLTFAVAQKKYVYIYDHDGVELHRLDKHIEVRHMEFLPFHFLLSTIGNAGHLKWTDTSTGQSVAEHPTKLGTPTSFRQNPHNAMIHVGHQNGTVTMWSPNSGTPSVKLLAHRGPVRSLAMDREGRYMVSTGSDLKMSVWDIRMFKQVNQYFLRQPGTSLDISEKNLTAVSWGTQTTIWQDLFTKHALDQKKVQSPYMAWGGEGQRIERVRWCPFEDTLGVSHNEGFTSVIIPGAGEANFDSLEINPYETKKQRQETEVRSLMNKLQPGMISLDPDFVGNVDLASHETKMREKDLDRKPEDRLEELKNRGRGRNSALRRLQRKRGMKNVIDEHRMRIDDLRKKQMTREEDREEAQKQKLGPALSRFVTKYT